MIKMKREEMIKELKEMELIKFYIMRCNQEIEDENQEGYYQVWNALVGAVQMYLIIKKSNDTNACAFVRELLEK